MADLSGVTEAYELAVHIGLIDLTATRVRRDSSQPEATDALVCAFSLADAALELGVFLGDPPDHVADLVDAVSAELPGVIAVLYAAGEPVAVDELAEQVADEIGLDDDNWVPTTRGYLERAFERFERLGMLVRLGVHVPPDRQYWGVLGERTTTVTLTPLGVAWLQQTLPTYGVRAPLVGDLAALPAAELLEGLTGYSLEAGEVELAAWTELRGASEAARQLAELLSDADVGRRQFALAMLDKVPDAESAVRPLLDDATARPYARVWLESHGVPVDDHYYCPEDDLLLFVDTAGVMVEHGAINELVAQLPGLGSQERQIELVRHLWRVDSPFTSPVLQALAASAPASVSKAARKALHSLRSAGR